MQFYIDHARKVIKENQDLFNIFEELDKTGVYRKAKYKKRVNFTVDEEVFNRFRSYCKKNNIKMSSKIEEWMKKEMKSS